MPEGPKYNILFSKKNSISGWSRTDKKNIFLTNIVIRDIEKPSACLKRPPIGGLQISYGKAEL